MKPAGIATAVGFANFTLRTAVLLQQADSDFRCGTEHFIEAYFIMPLHKLSTLTADYLRINCPNQNAERGLVSPYAIRFYRENEK